MKRILFILPFIFVSYSFAQNEVSQPKPTITSNDYRRVIPGTRKSALWAAKTDEKEFRFYLRFYKDGRVISTCSSGTPTEIKGWFKVPIGSLALGSGKYSVHGTSVTFSTTSPSGTVDYEGILKGLRLDLRVVIHADNSRATETYYLVVAKKRKLKKNRP